MKLQATVDPTWNLCAMYPLLLGGQKQCRMRNLLKVFTHGQLGNRTPDLSLSGITPEPLDHELPSYRQMCIRFKEMEMEGIAERGRLGGRELSAERGKE